MNSRTSDENKSQALVKAPQRKGLTDTDEHNINHYGRNIQKESSKEDFV